MATTVGDERKTSTIYNLPIGFYYYLIPRNKISSATYLGFVDTIQSLTFNPFIEESNINSVVECTFNSDKYGIPDGGISIDCIIIPIDPYTSFKYNQDILSTDIRRL